MKQFLAFVLVISLFSCQKDFLPDVDPVDPPPSPTTTDSSYLDKVFYLGTSTNSNDTTDVEIYTYDNAKRLSKMYSYSYPILTGDLPVVEKYIYPGTDTLPTIIVSYDSLTTGRDTSEIIFITYNSSGKFLKDSIRGFSAGALIDISINSTLYNANYAYSSGTINLYSGGAVTGTQATKDTFQYDPEGRLLFHARWATGLNSTVFAFDASQQVEYDTKLNPLFKLNNYNFESARNYRFYSDENIPTKYNYNQVTENIFVPGSAPLKYENLYNSKDRIIRKKALYSGSYNSMAFTYKAL